MIQPLSIIIKQLIMGKLFFLLLLVFAALACDNSNTLFDNKDCIIINTEDGRKIALSEFCSNINYLPLESNSTNLIGHINKVSFSKDKIYIFDSKTMRILIFNNKGKYFARTNSNGRGPGEYLNIADFSIDTRNNTIYIWDNGNHKVILLDQDGKFIRERHFKLHATNFSQFSENSFAYFTCNNPNPDFFNRESYNIILTDSNNTFVNNFLPITDLEDLRFEESGSFIKYQNGVNFTIPFDNTIYCVTENNCEAKYHVKFSNYEIPNQVFATYNKEFKRGERNASTAFAKFLDEINSNKYAMGIHNIFESENFLLFQYNLTLDGTYTVFFDKKSKHLKVGIPDNNIDFGLFGNPIALLQDTLITYIFPYDLDKKIKTLESNKSIEISNPNFKNLKNLSSSLQGFENPIIVKFVLKEF